MTFVYKEDGLKGRPKGSVLRVGLKGQPEGTVLKEGLSDGLKGRS